MQFHTSKNLFVCTLTTMHTIYWALNRIIHITQQRLCFCPGSWFLFQVYSKFKKCWSLCSNKLQEYSLRKVTNQIFILNSCPSLIFRYWLRTFLLLLRSMVNVKTSHALIAFTSFISFMALSSSFQTLEGHQCRYYSDPLHQLKFF